LARIARPLVDEEDLNVEVLFQDPLVVAADMRSGWARRRKINPAELVEASWILTAPGTGFTRVSQRLFKHKGSRCQKSAWWCFPAFFV
jgi:hypothetical protein